jgi:hypothetical protein
MEMDGTTDPMELLESMRIKKIERSAFSGAGKWVIGTMGGHRFEAMVFPEHAECASFELGDSRISKLLVQRLDDRQTVAHFERGWDVKPTTPVAGQIVDLLAAGLAEHVYGE